MSRIFSVFFHAILACSVSQLAKAAPAIALHSLQASGGAALGVAGHQPCLKTLSRFKLDHTYVDGLKSFQKAPLDETIPFVNDTQQTQAKRFGWVISILLKQPNDAPAQSLGLETADQWKAFAKQYSKLTGGEDGSLRDWLEKNHVIQGRTSEEEVSDLEWLLHRASSQKGIWWKSNQLAHWRKSMYDWKSMITVGDQLQFDHTTHEFKLSKTRIREIQKGLIPVLESGKWNETFMGFAFSAGNHGAEASQELQTLRAIGGEDSLYDQRMGQVVGKIVGKMDSYQGDQVELPAHLELDLYLLALLRGKVLKPTSDAHLQYLVDMPHHTITVHKYFDGQELRASFRSKARGRLLPENYEPRHVTAEATNRRWGKVRPTSPNAWQLDHPVSLPPKESPSQLNKTMLRQLTEFPSTGITVEKRGGGGSVSGGGRGGGGSSSGGKGSGTKGTGGKTPTVIPTGVHGHHHSSAASRTETSWAVPARVLEKLGGLFTN